MDAGQSGRFQPDDDRVDDVFRFARDGESVPQLKREDLDVEFLLQLNKYVGRGEDRHGHRQHVTEQVHGDQQVLEEPLMRDPILDVIRDLVVSRQHEGQLKVLNDNAGEIPLGDVTRLDKEVDMVSISLKVPGTLGKHIAMLTEIFPR